MNRVVTTILYSNAKLNWETGTFDTSCLCNNYYYIEEDIERLKLCSTNQCNICGRYEKEECILERNGCEQHFLSDYKRVLKMNEVLLKENEELKEKLDKISKVNFPIIY